MKLFLVSLLLCCILAACSSCHSKSGHILEERAARQIEALKRESDSLKAASYSRIPAPDSAYFKVQEFIILSPYVYVRSPYTIIRKAPMAYNVGDTIKLDSSKVFYIVRERLTHNI